MKRPFNIITAQDAVNFAEKCEGNQNVLDEYQRIATQSAIYPGQGTPFGLMYAGLGLAEAGEVQNKLKKFFRDDACIVFREIKWDGDCTRASSAEVEFRPVSSEQRQAILKELGGVLWYVSAVCNEIGAKLSDVARANLIELASRSERGTLGGSGDDR